MLIVDEAGVLLPYLGDRDRKIPNAHLKAICRVSEPILACRYAAKTDIGWVCAKNTPAKRQVDEAFANGVFKRNKGDNCDGFGVPDVPGTR